MSLITINVSGLTSDELKLLSDKLDSLAKEIKVISAKVDQLQMTENEALAIINGVADLTTKQGVALQAEGDTLQKISDEIDSLLKTQGVPAAVAERLQTLANGVQSVSDTIDAHAALSTAILAKGQPAIPVEPVPNPTPAP